MSSYINAVNNWDHFLFSFCLLFQSISFPLMVVLIKWHSKNLSIYRYYILNNILWCYVLTVFMYITRVTRMYPASCLISQGIIPISNRAMLILEPIEFFIICNIDLGVVFSLFYR